MSQIKNITVCLSQAAYNYKMLALHMKYKTPYKISKRHIGTLRKRSRVLIRGLMPLYSQKASRQKAENGSNQKTPRTWSSPLREPISQKIRSMTAQKRTAAILFSEMIRKKKCITRRKTRMATL